MLSTFNSIGSDCAHTNTFIFILALQLWVEKWIISQLQLDRVASSSNSATFATGLDKVDSVHSILVQINANVIFNIQHVVSF